jgi:hypothetical protein
MLTDLLAKVATAPATPGESSIAPPPVQQFDPTCVLCEFYDVEGPHEH